MRLLPTGWVVFSAIFLLSGLVNRTLAQRIVHTPEPPIADGSVQPVSGQMPAYQQPATGGAGVSVTIIAPSFVAQGKDIDYKLVVVNNSQLVANEVTVIHPLPKGAQLKKSDPAANSGGDATWSLGTLQPNGRKEISVSITPPAEIADLTHTAKVRCEFTRTAKTKIARPEIGLKIVAPPKMQQFDIVPMRIEANNPGLLETKDIQITVSLPEGMIQQTDAAAAQTQAGGPKTRSWTIPRLGPNEVRFLDFRVTAQNAGAATLTAHAASSAGAAVDVKSETVVQAPALEIAVNGPSQRPAHQSAVYRISIRNAGPFAMRNVAVTDHAPPGCEIVSVSDGGQIFDHDAQWIVPMLQAGESRVLELTARCPSGGKVIQQFAATYRGARQKAESTTEFSAAPALRMDVRAAAPAIEVGRLAQYSIEIENIGSANATNVRPVVAIPDSMSFASADPGHRRDGNRIQFDPVTIPAGGRATFHVSLKPERPDLTATTAVELLADHLPSGPIRQQVSTAITAGRPVP